MLELMIKRTLENKEIALIEDGKLIEYYIEENKDERKEGNIYIGIVKDIVKGMQAAFVDIGTEKNSFIHLEDIMPQVDRKEGAKENKKQDINEIVKRNQKLLVQVKKDSNDKKGARISTHINLPSKYIVLIPNTNIVTVSQKIEDKKERERLLKIVKENISEGNGAVIRTSAEGKDKELIEDIKYIENKWEDIISTNIDTNKNKAQLLYTSQDIVEKMLLDLVEKKLEKITVCDNRDYNTVIRIKKENAEYKNIQVAIKSEDSIFKTYDLEKQIEKSKNRKIWLKCGGFITIDKTEALTAIDVNTGKYTGKDNVSDTVYKVNEEATKEIAKQLRLRDIGGIIIIDYIDMKNEENKQKIEELLKQELKKDRTKTQVEGFSRLELMELTRKHICSHKN